MKPEYQIAVLPGDGIGHEVMTAARQVLHSGGKVGQRPMFWDGRSAQRIVAELARQLGC